MFTATASLLPWCYPNACALQMLNPTLDSPSSRLRERGQGGEGPQTTQTKVRPSDGKEGAEQ
jgi:hypothetical protein